MEGLLPSKPVADGRGFFNLIISCCLKSIFFFNVFQCFSCQAVLDPLLYLLCPPICGICLVVAVGMVLPVAAGTEEISTALGWKLQIGCREKDSSQLPCLPLVWNWMELVGLCWYISQCKRKLSIHTESFRKISCHPCPVAHFFGTRSDVVTNPRKYTSID